MTTPTDGRTPVLVEFSAGGAGRKSLDPRNSFLKLFFGKAQEEPPSEFVQVGRGPRIQFVEPDTNATPKRRRKRPPNLQALSVAERRRSSISSPNTPYSTHPQPLSLHDNPPSSRDPLSQLLRKTLGVGEEGRGSPLGPPGGDFRHTEWGFGRCAECGGAFSMFRRKYYCRQCGKSFCSACTEQVTAGEECITTSRMCAGCLQTCSGMPTFFQRRKKRKSRLANWFRPANHPSLTESSETSEDDAGPSGNSSDEGASAREHCHEACPEPLAAAYSAEGPHVCMAEEASDGEDGDADAPNTARADLEKSYSTLFVEDVGFEDSFVRYLSPLAGLDLPDTDRELSLSGSTACEATPRFQAFGRGMDSGSHGSPDPRASWRSTSRADYATFMDLRDRSKQHLRDVVTLLLEKVDSEFHVKPRSPNSTEGMWDEVPRGDLERMSEELARAMACPLKGADPDTDEPSSGAASPLHAPRYRPFPTPKMSVPSAVPAGRRPAGADRHGARATQAAAAASERGRPASPDPAPEGRPRGGAGPPVDVAAWADTICRLAWQAVTSVQPWLDAQDDRSMDIRHYVKVKPLPGGRREESACCRGVVFRKSLANRKMRPDVVNPRVLLLAGDLEVERQQAMTQLGESFLGEHDEWLSQLFKRLEVLNPDLILVEKSVNRFAQDRMVEAQISLAMNVKRSVLKRVARCTGGKVVPQLFALNLTDLIQQRAHQQQQQRARGEELVIVEHVASGSTPLRDTSEESFTFRRAIRDLASDAYSPLSEPPSMSTTGTLDHRSRRRSVLKQGRNPALPDPLGTCGRFRTRRMGPHTYFFLEDCPGLQGCTITLRGEGESLMKRLKYITQFAVTVAYNLILESFYLLDSHATLAHLDPDLLEEETAADAAVAAALVAACLAAVTPVGPGASAGAPPPAGPRSKYRLPTLSAATRHRLSSSLQVCFPELAPAPGEPGRPRVGRPPLPPSLSQASSPCHRRLRDVHRLPMLSHSLAAPIADLPDSLDDMTGLPFGDESPLPRDEELCRLYASYGLPFHHQSIVILAGIIYGSVVAPTSTPGNPSSGFPFAPTADAAVGAEDEPSVPVKPPDEFQLVVMKYYDSQANDLTLGQFLTALFDDHRMRARRVPPGPRIRQRYYAHHHGCVILTVEPLEGLPADSADIATWSFCRLCQREVSPRAPLSSHTLRFSFGKFLETTFYNADAVSRVCGHSLHRDMKRFFAHQGLACVLTYNPVDPYSIDGPEVALTYKPAATQKFLEAEWDDLRLAVREGYHGLMLELEQLRRPPYVVEEERLTAKMLQAKEEGEAFLAALEDMRGKVTVFQLNELRQQLCLQLTGWNPQVEELCQRVPWPETEKDRPKDGADRTPGESGGDDDGPEERAEVDSVHSDMKRMSLSDIDEWFGPPPDLGPRPRPAEQPLSPATLGRSPIEHLLAINVSSPLLRPAAPSEAQMDDLPAMALISPKWAKSMPGFEGPGRRSSGPRKYLSGNLSSGTGTSEFEAYPSAESMSSLRKLRSRISALSLNPPTSPHDTVPPVLLPPRLASPVMRVALPGSREGFAVVVRANEPTSIIAFTLCSREYWAVHPFAAPEEEEPSSSNVSSLSRSHIPIVHSMPSLALPSAVPQAPTLASLLLLRRETTRLSWPSTHPPEASDLLSDTMSVCSEAPSMLSAYHFPTSASFPGPNPLPAATRQAPVEVLVSREKFHFEYTVREPTEKLNSPESRSRTLFQCTVYFARQFAALRHLYCNGDDSTLLQSLTRCDTFRPTGGKSGSTFVKTKDDRFVLKLISKVELTHILTVAHRYFEYMARTYQQRLPTVLVKILGLFKVTCKATQSSHAYVLMENLFYGHTISKVYDLKGSMRNRFQANQNATLLDENLVQQLTDAGACLFTREADKDLLAMSIHNDTLLLSQLNVMDYSLLVGVDAEAKRLVVGIIDYIREYTIDKQMEYLVKSSGMMGGGKTEPTVIQPRLYKQRFRQAMRNYFLVLPSKVTPWTQQIHGFKTVLDKPLRDFMLRATFHFFAPPQAPQPKAAPIKPPHPIPSDNISQLL